MAALASLASAAPARASSPRRRTGRHGILVLDATPDDRAALARIAARHGAGDQLVYAPILPTDDTAAIVAAARAVVLPVVSEASGLVAIDALAAGVPVIASAVGALPEIVGSAGILVEPRDRERLAVGAGDRLGRRAGPGRDRGRRTVARERGDERVATWVDVANEVRAIYATSRGASSGEARAGAALERVAAAGPGSRAAPGPCRP